MSEQTLLDQGEVALREIIKYHGTLVRDDELAGPQDLADSIVSLRAVLDRCDRLVGKLLQLRAAARTAALDADFTAQAAWDESVVGQRSQSKAAVVSWDGSRDFTAPRERYAEAQVSTVEFQRAKLAAQKEVVVLESQVEIARQLTRGLTGFREDLLVRLRTLQFLTSLET